MFRLVGEEIIGHEIDVSGEQVVDGGGAAAIGNFRHAEVALEHQQLAEQVPRLALALVSVIDFAGIGARVGDEVGQVVEGQAGARDQNERIGREHADRLEAAGIE